MSAHYYIGVDVGTASVRASVVDSVGQILSTNVEPITIWNPRPDYYQQSSANIWTAVTKTVKAAICEAGVEPSNIKGIGFDATCSLVVLDENFQPVTVSVDGEAEQNIILWMDHRAQAEADYINSTKHPALNSVGGTMSVEMQPPKLMWLKKNLPGAWEKTCHIFDLPDFLTWRASGSLSRSMCSVVCKCCFQADDSGKLAWDDDFLSQTGLDELKLNNYAKIGSVVQHVGSPCGSGLTKQAAQELGLVQGTPVGTSLIDAHAGAVACIGCSPKSSSDLKQDTSSVDNKLVLTAGTSTCLLICGPKCVSVPGVWGPYYSVMIPGKWSNEGGQSATGSLIDFVTFNHSAFGDVKRKAADKGKHPYEYLNDQLEQMAVRTKSSTVAHLTKDFHVWPDYHGNRSPVADSSLKGMVCGLSLSATEDDLALVYLATVQALAYGTKHIVSEMEKCGHSVSGVYLCGGLRKNRLYVQTHTDVLGQCIVLPEAKESVLLGAAMLGACASGNFDNLQTVITTMGGKGNVVEPDIKTQSLHNKKYQVFLEMLKDQKKYKNMMRSSDAE